MSEQRIQPEPKIAQAVTGYQHLVDLCEQGKLYEAEEWLEVGHTAAKPDTERTCVLQSATRRGFHSLVDLLLQHQCTEEQKLWALEEAAEAGNLEICKLLVEAGAAVDQLSFWHLDNVVNRPLIEYLLDHGLDLSKCDGLGNLLVYRRVKPLLGLFLQNRNRFPEWEEQAAKALSEFIRKRDLKWISLMIWAKTDPWLPVHDLSEEPFDPGPDDSKRSAVEFALWRGDMEILRLLKVVPTEADATRLLTSAWCGGDTTIIRFLVESGADVNVYDPERGSLLYRTSEILAYGVSGLLSLAEPRATVELISWLIRKGAKWQPPTDLSDLEHLRRRLYQGDGELVVEAIRLLHAGKTCDPDLLRRLADKPKMKGWILRHDRELFRSIFEPEDALLA